MNEMYFYSIIIFCKKMNSTYIFPQVDTLIHHQALLFMCAVPSFKMISLEQKALLVTDTTELLAIFRKVN